MSVVTAAARSLVLGTVAQPWILRAGGGGTRGVLYEQTVCSSGGGGDGGRDGATISPWQGLGIGDWGLGFRVCASTCT